MVSVGSATARSRSLTGAPSPRRDVAHRRTKTMQELESYLPAADIALSANVLDRIDELVAAGIAINPQDNSYGTAEFAPSSRRR